MHISIREERAEDYKQTEGVVKSAFAAVEISDKNEHELVARIRRSAAFLPELSLVAIDTEKEEIVGHLLLSKIGIRNGEQVAPSLALAPVSVAPDYQNQGVGKLLIRHALQKAKELGYDSVIVLGHPRYYPKFGFKPASFWGIKAPFEIPDEVFMAVELNENALDRVSGVVEYSSAFLG
ncbi:GNAT family N-acetyltransferase [Brevibacillus fluminis]|uniref:GNAT family N-acetyltransferase n=1 Tax=Brevibacillus fluminis TaxID=511487 RepID=UPI003F8BBEF7